MKSITTGSPTTNTEIAQPTLTIRLALAALSLSTVLSSLGTSIANVALPTLARAFHASFQQVQWVVLAYLLAITALVVTVGRLGDLVGRRRLLLCGIALFTFASLLCGVASILWLLIAARALQGVGAAAMLALTMSFVADIVSKAKTGSAMGLLGTMSAVGTALGPALGGLLIASSGWRAIFLVNLPLRVLAFYCAHRYLPDVANKGQTGDAGFDPIGTFLLTLTLAAYALAMTTGSLGMVNAALLFAAVVGLGLFIFAQTRVAAPLLRLDLFSNPTRSAGFAANMLATTVVMATLVVGPFYLSGALALDPATIGLVMSCGPIVAAMVGLPAGRIVDHFGAYRVLVAGLIAMAGGSCIFSMMPSSAGIPGYLAPLIVITAGFALFQAANNTAVMNDIPTEKRGVVAGLLNLSRNLGLVTGASVMGAVFARGAAPMKLVATSPLAVTAGMRGTFVVATALVVAALVIVLFGKSITDGMRNS